MAQEIKNLDGLSEAIRAAQRDLANAIAERWPVGSIVQARMGGHLLELRVTGPCYDTARFWAVNTKTGAARKVHYSDVLEGGAA